MKYFVEVSFPKPIGNGTLTYHLNTEIIPQLGSRAVVSVNRRHTIGYITRVHLETPTFKTLNVVEILDPLSLFSENMIKLAFIMAKNYICTVGETLHAMLPGGIKKKINRLVKVTNIGKTEIPDTDFVNWLSAVGWGSHSQIIVKFPKVASKISQWLAKGYIEISHEVSKTAGPKMIRVLSINQTIPINIAELTPKEKLVVEYMMKGNSALTASTIRKFAEVSIAPISQLKRKGILIETEEQFIREAASGEYYSRNADVKPQLSEDQQNVLVEIRKSFDAEQKPILVRGVTCSGKTEVYLRWVEEVINCGRTAIILVPEISLTPQMTKRFRDRFGNKVAILHSKLSTGERFDQWEEIRKGNRPVVVGARSAVFAPLPNIGTIILDEEGEPSFKQADNPRYHARDVAEIRCKFEKALLVMGSATPTLDAFHRCKQGIYKLVEMSCRVSDKKPPNVVVVDMRKELFTKRNRSMFSGELTNSLKNILVMKKQAILFLNKRGYSSFMLCRECGEAVQCSKCNVSLVFHSGSKILRCHYCGEVADVPTICPNCNSTAIKFFGGGTQRVEAEAKRYFPNARIARLDSDTTTGKGSMEKILDDFGQRKIDILIGTQMVAKGLDFPDVTLVGILAADSLLKIPDFRASERNFALLAQVSGRAGRGDTEGKVVLQTYSPEHHSIKFALTEDYYGFTNIEAENREEAMFPPYINLASFIVSALDSVKAEATIQSIHTYMIERANVPFHRLFGPSPASIERINGMFRFQLLLKEEDLDRLTTIIKECLSAIKIPHKTKIAVDVNPYFML